MQPYLPPYDDQFIPLSGSVRVGTDSFGQPIWEHPGYGGHVHHGPPDDLLNTLMGIIDDYGNDMAEWGRCCQAGNHPDAVSANADAEERRAAIYREIKALMRRGSESDDVPHEARRD